MRTFSSQQRSSRLSTHAIGTPQATRLRSPSTLATSLNAWGLPQETQDQAYLCGLVHDIGKIGLPAGLLEKPGALTLDERRQMQEHSAIGERILAHVDEYSEIAMIVRHHHERIDGQGYPDGLADEDIPLVSRIIAVADAYNAMTSDRPYRDAMPSRVARLRLAQAVDSQFDTAAVAAFEAILAGADEEYRLAGVATSAQFAQSSYADSGDSSTPVGRCLIRALEQCMHRESLARANAELVVDVMYVHLHC